MKNILRLTATVVLALSAAPAVAGDLSLQIQNGRVTLVARDVPARQILQEWARIGQTRIVNVEKLSGPLVTLELVDVPESQALEILLRSASGYMVARRQVPVPGTSEFDRIMILPTSRGTASAGVATPPGAITAGVQTPAGDADDQNNAQMQQQMQVPPVPAGATPVPVVGAGGVGLRSPEVTFDYANPQNNPLLNPQLAGAPQNLPMQQQGVGQQVGVSVPGMPITGQPGQPALTTPATTRPGVMVPMPQQQFRNPYGLPAGVQPGSVQAPPTEPDRAKYANPPPPPPPPQ